MRVFGDTRLVELQTGWQRLDGGAMFGVVPKALWNKIIEADAQNRIPLALRCLYIETGGRKIVVDTGVGDKFSDKENAIYGIENFSGGVRAVMRAQGLDPDAVTDVILTHLHFDHAGGATVRGRGGAWEPAFANARYYLQRRALDWAQKPCEKDRASFRPDDWRALIDGGRLTLLDGPCEVAPRVSLIVSEGHAVAQQLVKVDGGRDGTLLYCGDVIPTAAHLPLPYVMGYDLHPLTTIEEKRALLTQAAQENWILYYEHEPRFAATRVVLKDGKFAQGAVEVF